MKVMTGEKSNPIEEALRQAIREKSEYIDYMSYISTLVRKSKKEGRKAILDLSVVAWGQSGVRDKVCRFFDHGIVMFSYEYVRASNMDCVENYDLLRSNDSLDKAVKRIVSSFSKSGFGAEYVQLDIQNELCVKEAKDFANRNELLYSNGSQDISYMSVPEGIAVFTFSRHAGYKPRSAYIARWDFVYPNCRVSISDNSASWDYV